jgi:hypothetical protein
MNHLVGFVFSLPQSMKIFIMTFHTDTYVNSALSKIGFVFSNVPFQFVSDFGFSASDFRAKPGELALFFQLTAEIAEK